MIQHLTIYYGPALRLLPEPVCLPIGLPRRFRFSYPLNTLKDKYALHYLGTRWSMYSPNIIDLQDWAIDEARRLVDLSSAYSLEVWYEPRTDRLFLQFLLAV